MPHVTGTMIRDMLLCERRPHLDLLGDAGRRESVSPFVEMLWRGGCLHEDAVVAGLPGSVLDLRKEDAATRAMCTLAAMSAGDEAPDWIVGGRLELGDRLGVPDLIKRDDGEWCVGDIKSGGALDPAGRPNREYAVQVGHYASLVGDMGLGASDRAFVIDREGGVSWYDLHAPRGRDGSIAEEAADLLAKARGVVAGTIPTRPALSSACSMCHWRTVCREALDRLRDVTLVAGLGRALRKNLSAIATDLEGLAALDADEMTVRIPGLGRARLGRFRDRARLLLTPGAAPYARSPLGLKRYERELHLDLETNPLDGGLVYLHGIFERSAAGGRYHAFLAEGHDDEGRAFEEAWAFLKSEPLGHVYHYSRFERTSYRALQRRYPHVCTAEQVEELFSPARSTDLLVDVVQPHTEWPTNGIGIKSVAKHLGFSWRDTDASGAASIGWFVDWCDARSPELRRRILEYNEDDCRATAVLLDALFDLPVLPATRWPPLGVVR